MLARLFFVILFFSFSSFVVFAEERKPANPPARDIAITAPEQGFPRTRPQQPTVIRNKEELAKAFADQTTQEAILKEVDFTKEQLLFFAWAGSGQDRIAVDAEKSAEGEVVFRYRAGRTRDLRAHFRLFAMASEGKWKVESGN